ncbi:MAG: hypothetical protein ACOVVK_12920, partial [Elsteraceae bacterium]
MIPTRRSAWSARPASCSTREPADASGGVGLGGRVAGGDFAGDRPRWPPGRRGPRPVRAGAGPLAGLLPRRLAVRSPDAPLADQHA